MDGWSALSATEMLSWATLTGNLVTCQEWQIMRDMDTAFLHAAREKDRGSADGKTPAPPPGEKQAISAAAFDAVFG